MELSALFLIQYQQTFSGPLIQQLESLKHGGVFRTRGVIQEAQQGVGISCAGCFDSVIVQTPPPVSLDSVPISSMPDQVINSLGVNGITASAYTAPSGTTIPPLDGNTEGAVFYRRLVNLSAYLFQGAYYVCLTVTLPTGSVSNPAELILTNLAAFDLLLSAANG